MAQNTFIDYYEMFDLNRSMTEKELKKALGRKSVEVTKLEGSTNPNDMKTRKELQEIKNMILEAIKILGKAASRKAYDAELDEAVRAGRVNYEKTQEVQEALERARKYFEAQKYELALKYAKEALKANANTDEPHEIICRSLFMLGDYEESLDAIDEGVNAFQNAVNLWWLRVRIRIMMEQYDAAQAILNEALHKFYQNAQFAAEQAYLYFHAGQDEIGIKAVEAYLRENPNDMQYRQYVAYNLVEVANQYYKYDSGAEMLLISEEKDYKQCLKLTTLANQYYQDEYTREALNDVQKFGVVEYDQDNKLKRTAYLGISILSAVGAVFMLLNGSNPAIFMLVAVLAFIGVKVIDKYSYRPYWQVYRDYYRGYKEKSEGWIFNLVSFPFDLAMSWLDGMQ